MLSKWRKILKMCIIYYVFKVWKQETQRNLILECWLPLGLESEQWLGEGMKAGMFDYPFWLLADIQFWIIHWVLLFELFSVYILYINKNIKCSNSMYSVINDPLKCIKWHRKLGTSQCGKHSMLLLKICVILYTY